MIGQHAIEGAIYLLHNGMFFCLCYIFFLPHYFLAIVYVIYFFTACITSLPAHLLLKLLLHVDLNFLSSNFQPLLLCLQLVFFPFFSFFLFSLVLCLSSFSQVEHILNDRLMQFVDIDLHDVKVHVICHKANSYISTQCMTIK